MTGILGAGRAWLTSSPTRWYVVFCDPEVRNWWDWVFRFPPGFGHVYALRWDGWNWLLYHPHTAFTDVQIVAATDEAALWGLVEPGATVIEVQAFRPLLGMRGRWWVGPMTCVEQVKALLGVPVGRIFTPWQLYRFLLGDRRGPTTREITSLEQRGQGQQPVGQGQPWRRCGEGQFLTRPAAPPGR
jgi:hypothetical protein